jgi:hypothetical protein
VEKPDSPASGGSAPQDAKRPRDGWERLEVISKIVGGISIPVLGLLVTGTLQHQSENNRRAQLQANIIAEREKADSDVRAHMLDALLSRYLGGAKQPTDNIEDFRDRIMFLDLVMQNFQEYFNSKPLFKRLFEQVKRKQQEATEKSVDPKPWHDLAKELIDVARDATARQVASLEQLEASVAGDVAVPFSTGPQKLKRTPLYSTGGLESWEAYLISTSYGSGKPAVAIEDKPERFSIAIDVDWKSTTEDAARVVVQLYHDHYDGNKFNPGKVDLGKPIEFEVSYFSTPYMDNTRLKNGSRFSVLYKGCSDDQEPDYECRFPLKDGRKPVAYFQVVTFSEKFLSQRDRPYIDKILEQQIGDSKSSQ